MSAPRRKKAVVVEGTQQLQASDVLNVLSSMERGSAYGHPGGKPTRSTSPASQSSIAPVGLELAHGTDEYPAGPLTGSVGSPAPARRRRLGKIVLAAVGICAVILVAAGVTRIGQADAKEDTREQVRPTSSTAAPGPVNASTEAPGNQGASPAAAAPGPASMGVVRLARPTMAGHVWVDGAKISESSTTVSCGTHQVKVGRGRKHSIDVPCGGEISITR